MKRRWGISVFSAILFILTFATTITQAIRKSATYIFVLYQAYYFFNPPTKWWGDYIPDVSFSFYIVLSLLIIVFLNWRHLAQNRIRDIPQFYFLVFTSVLYFISQFYAVFPLAHSIALDALITATVLVLLVFKVVRTRYDFDIVLKGYVIFAGYLGYYISQVGRVRNGRFEGAGMVDAPDANGVAAALAPAIVLCIYYCWSNTKLLHRILYCILGAYIFNALVQIGSRGAFLGVVVGVAFYLTFLFFTKVRKKNQRKGVLGLVFVGLIGVSVVADSAFWDRMSTIKTQSIESAAEKESGSTRVYFWVAAIEMAKDYPFGGGASAFIYYSDFYIPQNIDTGSARNRAVHSTWFEVLTEIGYLGLLSFSLMIFYCFLTLKKAANHLRDTGDSDELAKVMAVIGGFLCLIVIMTFLNRFRAEILYWFVIFSGVAYNINYLSLLKGNTYESSS